MGLFGRKARGRHALGAAVTSIPSAPPPVTWVPQVHEAAAAPVDPVPEMAAPPTPATTAAAVAELLVTGAWRAEAAPAAAAGPVEVAPVSLPPMPSGSGAVTVRSDRPPAVAPAEETSARLVLEHALLELIDPEVDAGPRATLVPQQPAGVPPVPASAPRVQLGFRDGSSASLDPSADQYQALEHLARSLTRRD